MTLLERIDNPKQLKELSYDDLDILCSEIRDLLIKTVSKNGGHLAPNLGIVELTIAIHRALDCPEDKIIFDVGHQCYVHKILTGRRDDFVNIRTYGGISGFPKISESIFDAAGTGHASTAISLALGIAEARDKKKQDFNVAAIIGDGSLTGGMVYEALNHAGHHKKKMMIILNDNEMSIDSNVGAISAYLDRIRLDPGFNRLQEEMENKIKNLPGIGKLLCNIGENFKDSLKHLVLPGLIFEEMGIKYIGPVDGHDIRQVEEDIKLAKNLNEPVLIHVITKKGKGYIHAEQKPEKFHGIGSFDISTGEATNKELIPTYTEVFGDAILELAENDDNLVCVCAAMSAGTGLEKFAKKFSERFYDVGIAEEHAVTYAGGLAIGGMTPVVAIYSTFLQRAYDQIIHDIALQELPVIFAIDRAGIVGEDGPTHHGAFDISYLRSIPNMTIMCPSDESELRDMLYTAIDFARENKSPVAIRYPRGTGIGVPKTPLKKINIARAKIVRSGTSVAILAIGRMVYTALKAAELLSGDGIEITVVNMRFAKPIDEELIKDISNTHNMIITLEENTVNGGLGSAVLELLAKENIFTNTINIGIPDKFISHGSIKELHEELGLTPHAIRERINSLINEVKNLSSTSIQIK